MVRPSRRLSVVLDRPLPTPPEALRRGPLRPGAFRSAWSADARWTTVRVRDLVALVGGTEGSAVLVESLQRDSAYRTSVLHPGHTADPLTLIALRLGGAPLDADHGYPARADRPLAGLR